VVRPLEADQALKSAYEAWSAGRADFNVRLAAQDPGAVEESWQRHYFRGVAPTGERSDFHVAKRKLKTPRSDKES
jgi:anti-sigma factor RsiW